MPAGQRRATGPPPWRESMRDDLSQEAPDAPAPIRELWLLWHAGVIGIRFRIFCATKGDIMSTAAPWTGFPTDVRLAMRQLVRARESALAVVIILGMGIGAATATYNVFHHVVFRPLPGVVESDQLFTLYYQVAPDDPNRAGASFAHFEAMRDGSPAVKDFAAWQRRESGFGTGQNTAPDVVPIAAVTSGYFDVLGVRARAGRLFGHEDIDGRPVVMVSERFVTERLDGSLAVIGRELYLNGQPHAMVGGRGRFSRARPARWRRHLLPYRTRLAPEEGTDVPGVFAMVGKTPTGCYAGAGRVAVARVFQFSWRGPRCIQETFQPTVFAGVTDGIGLTRMRLVRIYRILLTGVLTLLVLACANAANLRVARNIRRKGDIAMRAALGS